LENIKFGFKEIKYDEVDWSLLAQDVDKRQGRLRMRLWSFGFHKMRGNFLSGRT